MARAIKVVLTADTKQLYSAVDASKRKLQSAADASSGRANDFRDAIKLSTAAITAFGVAGIAAFKEIASRAIDAAKSVNQMLTTLRALTGSAEAAEKRFRTLFQIAQKSPGLTTQLAATLDAQLRVFNVSAQTIDRLLPVIGKLNAISPLGDPKQFVNNLTQLISQNFERSDLKELVGQSPLAGNLIKAIFNVDNPTNAEAIRATAKKLGITTVERLSEELVKAASTNSALKGATDSIATQFEKLEDRITVALAPIGDEMLKTILPAAERLVTLLERDAPKITQLLRDNRDELLALAGAFVTAAGAVGELIGQFQALDQQF